MRALLRTRRWLGFTALAVAVACACVALSLWQLGRAEERSARGAAIEQRTQQPPRPVERLLPVGERVAADAEWRPATAAGRYDPAGTLLLRNRTLEGANGFHVLVPLVLDDGSAVLVDRGFLPRTGPATEAVPVPEPPPGQVRLTGRVRPGDRVDGVGGLDRSSRPQPSVSRVDVRALAVDAPYPLRGGYLELVEEVPAPAQALVPLPAPSGDNPGLNYAYALQWLVFAVIAVVGWFLLLRREARGPEDAGGARTAALAAVAGEPSWRG